MARKQKKAVRPDGWHCWQGMLRRCYYSRAIGFNSYGGRGISVCERWRHSFKLFLEDMGPRPSLKHSIDRIDNDLGYSPENCRWATAKEQQNNRRSNRLLSHGGRIMTMTQWAEAIGVTIFALYQRLKKMSVSDALTYVPPPLIHCNGVSLNASEWSKRTGIKACTIHKRIKDGWSVEDALTRPVRNWGR